MKTNYQHSQFSFCTISFVHNDNEPVIINKSSIDSDVISAKA